MLRTNQTLCRILGGDDMERLEARREQLFGGALRRRDRRCHGLNTKQIACAMFGFPHASLYTATQVLDCFDRLDALDKGGFASLRLTDYRYTSCSRDTAGSAPLSAAFR